MTWVPASTAAGHYSLNEGILRLMMRLSGSVTVALAPWDWLLRWRRAGLPGFCGIRLGAAVPFSFDPTSSSAALLGLGLSAAIAC